MTALRTSRIGHAYLFSGPRGCGKTTSARILARCLNCAEGPTDTPCGSCQSCIELSREGGGSLDVVEIDAASHGGVDDARELRERAVFAPARDRYKIFIIDEAHMVTSGGFNALLKIVEEPPPHVKFIFATTEPEKVIGTIRSRTHHYPFRLIAPGTLIDYVEQLCESEGVAVEPGVVPLVVRAGGGSVRDTLSILDQLIAGSEGDAVTLARASGLLGFTSAELIDETVSAMRAGDSAAAFAAVDQVVQTGQDPRRFVEDLLERFRDLIVISATSVQGAAAVFRGVPEDQLQRMFEQSQGFHRAKLSRIADVISAALDTMAGATAPRLQLELMVARVLLVSAAPTQEPPANPGGAEEEAQSAQRGAPAATSAGQEAVAAGQGSAVVEQGSPAAQQRSPAARQKPSTARQESAAAAQPVASSVAETLAAASSPVNVIATLRSAREFLAADAAGVSKPPIVPLGGMPGQEPQAGSASEPHTSAVPERLADTTPESHIATTTAPEHPAAAAPEPPIGQSLEELREVWPELLAELFESDREAWNAVQLTQPLALAEELLTLGFASRSDLEVFKAHGAGPLREAIMGALGFTVKYLPAPLPADTEHVPEVAAEHVSIASPAQPPTEPAPVAPDHEQPAQVEQTPSEQAPSEPIAAQPTDTSDSESAEPRNTTQAEPTQTSTTHTTRYGEAVVREVLGAKFIEERPLPPDLRT